MAKKSYRKREQLREIQWQCQRIREDDVSTASDEKLKHAAYADDLGGAGVLGYLRTWWNKVVHFGPLLGYYPKASKSWLVVKEDRMDAAREIFADTDINSTSEGRAYLGDFVGSKESRENYAKELVKKWCEQLMMLSKIAQSEPQAAYAAFVSGFQHKLTYYMHTLPNLGPLLQPFDEVLNHYFIPAITEGHHYSQDERKLLSLPARFGGLAIPIFSQIGETLAVLQERMNGDQKRANEIAQMKGASNWLTSLPIREENYVLNKREFYDAIRMRYRWPYKFIPTTSACGKRFSVDHALSCLKGGFVHQRHDEIRDLFGQTATEILTTWRLNQTFSFTLVSNSMRQQTGKTKQDWISVLVASGNVVNEHSSMYGVFNPFAPSYRNQKLSTAFSANEREKKRAYAERIVNVEHGSFTPLVFTPYGGSSRETEIFIAVLASSIAEKRKLAVSITTNWLRSNIYFALLRSTILYVRGSRSLRKKQTFDAGNIEIASATTKLTTH